MSTFSFYFTITDYVPPFLENVVPVDGSVNVDEFSSISFDLLDDGYVNLNQVDAYVNSVLVFSGPSTFIAPWNGPSSAVTQTTVDGYDGYHIVLDYIGQLNSAQQYVVRITARDMNNNSLDTQFSFMVRDYVLPFIENESPINGSVNVNKYSNIVFEVFDDGYVDLSQIDAYVNGAKVFENSSSFIYPWNGPSSAVTNVTNIDGYDGYHIVIDNIGQLRSNYFYTVRVTARDANNNSIESIYYFTSEDYVSPFLDIIYPTDNLTGVNKSTTISSNILDDGYLDLTQIDAYVDGTLVFSGPSTSVYPWSMIVTNTTVDGYDGYYLELSNINQLQNNKYYDVRFTARDKSNNSMDSTYTFRTKTDVDSILVSPFEDTIRVEFNSPISQTLLKTTDYVFNYGAYAKRIEYISNKVIEITTELLYGHSSFSILIENVIDDYGGVIETFSSTINPFYSTATFSNYNSKIKTGHESRFVFKDDSRTYVGGNRGIDVFKSLSLASDVRLGQIYDEYGITAMCVVNYGNTGLSISTTSVPYLSNIVPPTSSYLYPDSVIGLTINDSDVVVETTSVTIYINDVIVFSGGYGGWQNGYYGNIQTESKKIIFTIYSIVSYTGSSLDVRVVATNITGNELDTSYSYNIADSSMSWGYGVFGSLEFGY